MEKEKQCLVTQNLIGATQWCMQAPSSIIKPEKGGDGKTTWREKAINDLKNTLGRVPGDFPEAARRGVEFEKKVYEVVSSGVPVGGSENFKTICESVRGFDFFKKEGRKHDLEGNQCYFYAKYDAISTHKTRIVDLKTTEKYKNGKYLNGIQHKIYCWIARASNFSYVIAEWDEWPKIRAVHREEYVVQDIQALENDVLFATRECFDIIKDLGLWELYRTKYCLY